MNQSLLDPSRVLAHKTLPTYVANSISCQTRFLYLPRRIRFSTASPSFETSIHLHDSIVSFAAQTQCLFRMRKTQVSRTSLWMEQTKASCFAASSDKAFINHVFLYFFTTAKGNLTQTFNGSASDSLFFLHFFALFLPPHTWITPTHIFSFPDHWRIIDACMQRTLLFLFRQHPLPLCFLLSFLFFFPRSELATDSLSFLFLFLCFCLVALLPPKGTNPCSSARRLSLLSSSLSVARLPSSVRGAAFHRPCNGMELLVTFVSSFLIKPPFPRAK